jgi:hypothetical protein
MTIFCRKVYFLCFKFRDCGPQLAPTGPGPLAFCNPRHPVVTPLSGQYVPPNLHTHPQVHKACQPRKQPSSFWYILSCNK